MKKLIAAIILLVILLPVRAASEVEVKIPEQSFGSLMPDTASFIAFLVDKKTNSRDNKLRVKVASTIDGQGLWSAPYYKGRLVDVCDRGVLIQDAFTVLLYDWATGKELMDLKCFPVFIDEVNGLLIGVSGSGNTRLKCYSLDTLKLLWETKIPSNKGMRWEVIDRPDPNTVLFQSDYIGRINLKDGSVASYPIKQMRFDKKRFWLSNDIGSFAMLFGAVGGLIDYFNSAHNASYGMWKETDGSKVMSDSDGKLYVSDRDKIACLTPELDEVWMCPLPKGTSGSARIWLHNDTVKLLNTGSVLENNHLNKVARPFIGKFDKNIGECIQVDYFAENWDEEKFGKVLDFIYDTVYVVNSGSSYVPLEVPLEKAYVRSKNGGAWLIDTDFNILSELLPQDVFIPVGEIGDSKILYNEGDKCYICIDANGDCVEKYPATTLDVKAKGKRVFRVEDGNVIVTQVAD
ncbi:MAG: hypothetical protein K2G41_06790 [Duncaniella sp.]|uniref:hypothetical protein n=1 Tax=Duncaniella sp. TaxID=2518496 RepID=UPI0023C806E8|nr:hypothetical protein [Duncaniella sp.]MDE6090391.1 hypothetical protein [Duncaniella sp.]